MAIEVANAEIRLTGKDSATPVLRKAERAFDTYTDKARKATKENDGFFKGLLSGASKLGPVFAAGLGAVGLGFAGAAAFGLKFNNSMEQTTAKLNAFTKDGAKTAEILEMIRKRAAATPFAFEEMASATAGLMPAAKQANVSLEKLIETAEVLAASNPAEGLEGAAFALREAVSGDFTSIIERFNLPRTMINQLKKEGVPALEAVRQAMASMGYDTSLVTNMAATAEGRWSTFVDTLQGVAATATKPIFDVLSKGLGDVNAWLAANQPAVEAFAKSLAEGVATAISNIGQTITTWGPVIGSIGDLFDGGKADAFRAAVEKLPGPFKDIGTAIADFIPKWDGFWVGMQGHVDTFRAGWNEFWMKQETDMSASTTKGDELFNSFQIGIADMQKDGREFWTEFDRDLAENQGGWDNFWARTTASFGEFDRNWDGFWTRTKNNLGISDADWNHFWLGDVQDQGARDAKWAAFWASQGEDVTNHETNWDRFWRETDTNFTGFGADWDAFWLAIGTQIATFASEWATFWTNAGAAIEAVGVTVGTFLAQVGKGAEDIGANFLRMGENIIAGVKQGIQRAWDGFTSWFSGLFAGLGPLANRAIESKSPSQMFMRVGITIPEGIAEGVIKGWPGVQGALVNKLADMQAASLQGMRDVTDAWGSSEARKRLQEVAETWRGGARAAMDAVAAEWGSGRALAAMDQAVAAWGKQDTGIAGGMDAALAAVTEVTKHAFDKTDTENSIRGVFDAGLNGIYAHLKDAWGPQMDVQIKFWFTRWLGLARTFANSFQGIMTDAFSGIGTPAGAGAGGVGGGTGGGGGGGGGGGVGAMGVGTPGGPGTPAYIGWAGGGGGNQWNVTINASGNVNGAQLANEFVSEMDRRLATRINMRTGYSRS